MAEYVIGSVGQGTGLKNTLWRPGDTISAVSRKIMSFAGTHEDCLVDLLDKPARSRLKRGCEFDVRIEELIEIEDGERFALLGFADHESNQKYLEILGILGVQHAKEEMIASTPPGVMLTTGMIFSVGYLSVLLVCGNGDHTLLHDYPLQFDEGQRFEAFGDI